MKKCKIENYENYWIYSNGSIYNEKTKKFLKPRLTNSGYMYVSLCKHSKYKLYYIHRLVAHYFITSEHEGLEVNHIDGNKSNNDVSNLEWVSHRYNIEHGVKNGLISYKPEDNYMAKLNWDIIKNIRENYNCFQSAYFAKKYNISTALVSMIIHNKVWVQDDYIPPQRKKEVTKSFVSSKALF